MILHKLVVPLGSMLLVVFMTLHPIWAHEVVGEVTPLMLHMQHTLTLIQNGRDDDVLRIVNRIYSDFKEPMRQGIEAGLITNSNRVDRVFGTQVNSLITLSIEQRNLEELKAGLELLSFLLMLEKFDVLQAAFEKKNANLDSQETIFWLGRNYFSYLLEPTMGKRDPVEEKRLDHLLDRMLYSLQDGEWEIFIRLRED